MSQRFMHILTGRRKPNLSKARVTCLADHNSHQRRGGLVAVAVSVVLLTLTATTPHVLPAQGAPASMESRIQRLRVSLPVHGHILANSIKKGYRIVYTYPMSDSLPTARLLFSSDGTPYLAYADGEEQTRVARLGKDFAYEREVFSRAGMRLEDALIQDDGITLLLTEFDRTAKGRHYHSIRLTRVALDGRVQFEAPIIGSRSYTKEGDQGIGDAFSQFNLAYFDGKYAAYFNTYRRWDDGVTHQSEYLAFFDRDGRRIMADNGGQPLGYTWNVSHSFRPRFATDGKALFFATTGDAYPRGLVVDGFPEHARKVALPAEKAKPGETYQYVPISTGDIAARDGSAWIVFDSARGKENDIGLFIKQGRDVKGPVWLTSTPSARERIPRIAPLGTNFLVVWGVDKGPDQERWFPSTKNTQLQATLINEKGDVVQGPETLSVPMRAAARFFRFPNKDVGWINDDTGEPNQIEIVRFSATGQTPNKKPEPTNTTIHPEYNFPLLSALYGKNEGSALALIERGADPNAEYGGWSALMYAAYGNLPKAASALLARGARTDQSIDGMTALSIAESMGHSEIVGLLGKRTTLRARQRSRTMLPQPVARPQVRARDLPPADSLRSLGTPRP